MKKLKGFSVVGVVIGVLVVAILGVLTFFVIDGNNNATKYEEYDFFSIIGPTKDNGEIGDHIKGNPEAPVVIYEFADFQCSACALYNPYVNKLVEELDGKLAIVYRSYLLSYHPNGTAAASAAEAAGLQGYWKPYGDKLFAEQNEWYYATGSERTELFNKYFTEVTEGKGDLEKFNQDLASKEVSKKVNFDMGIGTRVDVQGTPAFYIDGKWIRWAEKNGGSITVNGQLIEWDSPQTGDNFTKLMKKIVAAKLGEKVEEESSGKDSSSDKSSSDKADVNDTNKK